MAVYIDGFLPGSLFMRMANDNVSKANSNVALDKLQSNVQKLSLAGRGYPLNSTRSWRTTCTCAEPY